MRQLRGWRAVLILAILALVAAACTGDTSGTTTTSATSEGPTTTDDGSGEVDDTELVIAIDPLESPNLSAEWAYDDHRSWILGNVLERLVGRDPVTNELGPRLAISWEQVDDLTWRFTLREGVKFHDGSPFNSEAAAAALTHMHRENEGDVGRLAEIAPREAPPEFIPVDEYTLDIVTVAPEPLMPGRMAQASMPSGRQITDDIESYPTQPIGTGPYVLESYDTETEYVLVRNEDWWGLDNPQEAYGVPVYDRVRFLIRPEPGARAAAVQAGEVDFAFNIGQEGCEQVEDLCLLQDTGNVIDVRFDLASTYLGDPRVREALNIGFDRYTLAEQLYGGATVTAQPLRVGAVGQRDDIEPWPYDPERAAELLDEAKADGVVFDAPIRLVTLEGRFPRNQEFVEALKFAWEALDEDIEVSIEIPVGADQFNSIWQTNETTTPPDRHMIGVHTSSDIGLFDLEGYVPLRYLCGALQGPRAECDLDFDARYGEARSLIGDARREAMELIAQEIHELAMYSPVLFVPNYHAASENVSVVLRGDAHFYVVEGIKPAE